MRRRHRMAIGGMIIGATLLLVAVLQAPGTTASSRAVGEWIGIILMGANFALLMAD